MFGILAIYIYLFDEVGKVCTWIYILNIMEKLNVLYYK